MNDSFQQGLQLKGEIMDLEFTLDTDHRSVVPLYTSRSQPTDYLQIHSALRGLILLVAGNGGETGRLRAALTATHLSARHVLCRFPISLRSLGVFNSATGSVLASVAYN